MSEKKMRFLFRMKGDIYQVQLTHRFVLDNNRDNSIIEGIKKSINMLLGPMPPETATLPSFATLFGGYLLLINFITFFLYGLDKGYAGSGHRRLSERFLLGLILIGGSVGALLGMRFFRHKTRKFSFLALVAVILLAQLIFCLYLAKITGTLDFFLESSYSVSVKF